MRYRLGLDIGTNSIGWAVVKLDSDDCPITIKEGNSRIFNDGRHPKTLASLKADRRVTRQASRRRDRFLRRQKNLITALVELGFWPSDETERKKLASKDPWAIRARAVSEQISPEEAGRAFFHLNQRRGFKSNRKSGDSEAGLVKRFVTDLREKLKLQGAETLGAFLAKRHANNGTVRARRHGTGKDDLYELYPDRAMLEGEFDSIWKKQACFNDILFSDKNRDRIRHIIFHQRPLKPVEPGKCQFLPEENRAAKALPSVQRFRIYQELANLQWIDGRGHPVTGSSPLRDSLAKEMEEKRKLSFAGIRRIMKKMEIIEYDASFNLESEKRDHLKGNETAVEMRKILGAFWNGLSEDRQDDLVAVLLDDVKTDEEAAAALQQDFSLTAEQAEACLDAKLASGYGSVSLAAIQRILPVMRDQGLQYWQAVEEAGLGTHNLYDPDKSVSDRLSYYGAVITGDVVGGSGKPEESEEKRYGAIPNPTVHIALNQIRQVVNELIDRFGKPEQIALELARDLPLGADGKKEIISHQSKNQKKNERIAEELERLGQQNSRENRQRFQLWEELGKDPTDRRCPFTGEMIGLSDLFTDRVEIEHLLPYSRTLDDSMSNKTVCMRQANRDKGNRTPFEAFFGDSPGNYDWPAIMERVNNLPKAKQHRFSPDAMQRFDEEDGWLNRQLNDTRYIARYSRNYLTSIVPQNQIWVVTGHLTAMLRGKWGLNGLLRGHNAPQDEANRKLRDDHRHHAIDAIVIALTDRSMVQKLSTAAANSESSEQRQTRFKGDIEPLEDLIGQVRSVLDRMIVSHRPRKKNQGGLHRDTAYGIKDFNPTGPSKVVVRKSIESFKNVDHLEKICDPHIRSALRDEVYDASSYKDLSGKEFETAVQDWCRARGIRRLKCEDFLTVIPIKDRQGRTYKGYEAQGNAYMDIWEVKDKNGQPKWQGAIVQRFKANQPDFDPASTRPHPAARKIMQLRINDMIAIPDDAGQPNYWRVQKLSGSRITLAPHNEANVDARNRNSEDPFEYKNTSPSGLQNECAYKIHISPTGLISRGR